MSLAPLKPGGHPPDMGWSRIRASARRTSPDWLMDLCFSTLACPDWSWEEILRRGTEYGYTGVEVRLLERETDLLSRPEFAPSQISRRRSELESHGFRVAGLASSVKFDEPGERNRQQQLAIGRGYVDLVRELGAEFVRVFGDVLPPACDSQAREETLANIASGLQALADYSARSGIQILLETHGDFSDSHLVADLMRRANHPWVGVLWDTHHPWRFCQEAIGESQERLRPWIRHTHWKDSVPRIEKELTPESRAAEARATRLMGGHRPAAYVPLGEGEFPSAECFRRLKGIGYSGWYCYEWEKAWHPEIDPPEVALPGFPPFMQSLERLIAAD